MDFHTLGRKDLQALCKKNQIRANLTNTAMADALQALATVQGLDELHNLNSPTQVKVHAYPTRSHSTRKQNKRMKIAQGEEEHQGVDEAVSSTEVSGEQFHYSPETGGLVDLTTSDLVPCSKNLITVEEITQSEPVTINELNLDPTSDKVSGAATFKLQPCSLGTEIAKNEVEEFELQSPEIRAEVNEQIEELQSSAEGTSETTDMDTDQLVLSSELLIEGSGELLSGQREEVPLIEGSGELLSGQREEVPSADAEIFEEKTPPEPVTRSSHPTELNLDCTPDKESAAAIFKLQHCSQGAKSTETKDEEFKVQSPEIRTIWDEPIVKLSEMVDEQSMQNAVEGRSEAMDLDTDRSVSLSEIMIEGTGEPLIKQISRGKVIRVDVEFSEEEARQLEPVTTTSSHLIAVKTDLTSDKGSSAIFKLQHCNQGTENQKIECEESDLQSLESRTGYDEPKEKLSDMEQVQGMQGVVGGRSEAMELDTDRPVLPSEILIEGSGDFHTLCWKDLQALCKKNQIRANMTITAMADALQALPTVQGLDEFHNLHSRAQVKAEASGTHVHSASSQSTRKHHKRMKATQEEEEHKGVDEVVSSAEVLGEQFHYSPETGGLVDLSTSDLVLRSKNLIKIEEMTQSELVITNEHNLGPTSDNLSGAANFKLQPCSLGIEIAKNEDEEFELQSPEIRTEVNEQIEELQSSVKGTSETMDMDTDRLVLPSELLIEGFGELSSGQREEVPLADAEIFEERTPSELVTRSSHLTELNLDPTPDKESAAAMFKLQHCSQGAKISKTEDEEFKLQSPEIKTGWDEPIVKLSEMVDEQSMQNAAEGRSEAMDLDTDRPVSLSEIMIEGTGEPSIKHISRGEVISVDVEFSEEEARQLESVTTTSSHLIAIKTDLTSDKGSSAIFKLQHCNQGTENQKIECDESDLRSLESRIGYVEPKEKLSDMEQEQGMESAAGGRGEAMELDTDRPVLPSEILIEGSGDFHTLCRKDLQALYKKNQIRANMTITAMADSLQALPTVQGLDEYHNVHSPTQVKAEASGPLVYSTRSQSTWKQQRRMKTTQEEEEHTGVDEVVPSAEVSGEQFHHTPETGGLVDLSTSALVLRAKNLTTMEETTQSEPVTAIELNLDPSPDEVSGVATFILQRCSRGTESDKTEDKELKLLSPEISTEGNEQREELQSAVGLTSEATDMDADRPVSPSELLIEGSGELSSEQREKVPTVDTGIFVEERMPSEPVTRSSHIIELKLNPTPDKWSPAAIFKLQHCSRATESMKTGEEEFKLQSPEIRTECDEPTEKPSNMATNHQTSAKSESVEHKSECSPDFISIPSFARGVKNTNARTKILINCDPRGKFLLEHSEVQDDSVIGDETPVQSKDRKTGDALKGQNQRNGDDSMEKLHGLSLRKLKLLYKESREAKGLMKKEGGCGGQEPRAESKEDGVKNTDWNDLSLRKLKQKLKEKLRKHDQS